MTEIEKELWRKHNVHIFNLKIYYNGQKKHTDKGRASQQMTIA